MSAIEDDLEVTFNAAVSRSREMRMKCVGFETKGFGVIQRDSGII